MPANEIDAYYLSKKEEPTHSCKAIQWPASNSGLQIEAPRIAVEDSVAIQLNAACPIAAPETPIVECEGLLLLGSFPALAVAIASCGRSD